MVSVDFYTPMTKGGACAPCALPLATLVIMGSIFTQCAPPLATLVIMGSDYG